MHTHVFVQGTNCVLEKQTLSATLAKRLCADLGTKLHVQQLFTIDLYASSKGLTVQVIFEVSWNGGAPQVWRSGKFERDPLLHLYARNFGVSAVNNVRFLES